MSSKPKALSIRTENLSVIFNRWGQTTYALADVSLNLESGHRVLLSGGNGAGKSTLLNVLNKKIIEYSGEVYINNQDLTKYTKKQLASMVFQVNQNPLVGTIPSFTVLENFKIANSKTVVRSADFIKRIHEELSVFGLQDKSEQLVGSLSGGQRQIIAMLIAKMRAPEILLLDEPTSALDQKNRSRLNIIVDSIKSNGTTVIEVNHDADPKNYDQTFQLEAGKLIPENNS